MRKNGIIDIKHFALQQWVEKDLIDFRRIATHDNSADAMTKATPRTLFYRHMNHIMGKLVPAYATYLKPEIVIQPLYKIWFQYQLWLYYFKNCFTTFWMTLVALTDIKQINYGYIYSYVCNILMANITSTSIFQIISFNHSTCVSFTYIILQFYFEFHASYSLCLTINSLS